MPTPNQRAIVYRNGVSTDKGVKQFNKYQEECKDDDAYGKCPKCSVVVKKRDDGTLRAHYMGVGRNKIHCLNPLTPYF
jgi:hypothetical protein